MTTYCFKAQALTPIHVGSGREIDPLEFVLREDHLVHFRVADLLSSLSPPDRESFLQIVDRCDLKAIQTYMSKHYRVQSHDPVSIGVSQQFKKEFEQRASNPNKQFRVDMMPRNLVSGRSMLPGSSIKGAIRTAVVNYFANLDQESVRRIKQDVRSASARKKGEVLEEAALNRKRSETERDLFRLIKVKDIALPDGATRIDRAINWNPNKSGSENIQMWIETIQSLAATSKAPTFEISITFDTDIMKHKSVQRILGRTLDIVTLLNACNKFYWGRMIAEGNKFYGKASGGAIWKRLYGLFPRGKTPEGKILTIDPDSPYWFSAKYQRKRVLLRVGRFSHFESLSVDNLRQGYNVQAQKPILNMGNTRTLCAMENDKPAMPFGWLVLSIDAVRL